MRLCWYIECFHNTRRRHSGLGYRSPADYEREHLQEAIPAWPPGVNASGSTPSPVRRYRLYEAEICADDQSDVLGWGLGAMTRSGLPANTLARAAENPGRAAPVHVVSEPVAVTEPGVAKPAAPEFRDCDSNRSSRWPRHWLASALLSGLLVATYAPLLVLGDRMSFARPVVFAIAVLMAIAVRALYEAPLPARLRHHRHADLFAAARAATIVSAGGWIGVTALGLPHHPVRLLARWTIPALILLGAKRIRRAETQLGTGGRVFFVGTEAQLEELRREVAESPYLELVGAERPETIASPEELVQAINRSRATAVILSDEAIGVQAIVEAAVRLNLTGFRVRDLRSFFEQEFDKVAVGDLSLSWFLFDIAAIHRRHLYGSIKRGLETAVAAGVLVVTAPLLPLIALAIRLSSPGPVLFRQARVGRDGEIFTLTKFRTMHQRDGAEHGEWAGACTARLFGVGRLLRRSRLDEIPQLVSVVRGKLSLVGPRPEQPEIVERLEKTMPYYPARHVVRPGLTGWAQVNMGYGGSEAGSLTKLQYDLFYIKRQSLGLDLRIMASTARAILFGSAY